MSANPDFGGLVARHRAYFLSGKTRPVKWRAEQLAALSALITENAREFRAALWTDLRLPFRACGVGRPEIRAWVG